MLASLDPRLGVIVLVGREISRELMALLAEDFDLINTRYHFAYDHEQALALIAEFRQ